jgi:diacylglycerol kinase family enzyme
VLKTLLSAGAAMRLRVSVDGETHRFRSPLLFVAMNPFQLDLFSLEGRECLEDDRFAVYAVPDASRPRLMGLAARLAVGGLRPREHFTLYCGSEVVVESDRARHTLAFDGERARHASPFRFRLRARALKAMLPREDARAEAGAAVREDARGGA